MSYTYATGKSDRDLASYQGVRGAEIKAIGTTVRESTPVSQVHNDFVRPAEDATSDSVDNTLTFLQAIDFIDRPEERIVEPVDDQPFADLPFELRALYHLSQQKSPQDHFARIYDVVVAADVLRYDKSDLKEDLERELDEYSFDWTIQKVQTWYNIVAQLGLIDVHDNQEILTSPEPPLMYDLLDRFQHEEGSNSVREALEWIEEHFFPCFTDRGGHPLVHAGLSETVLTMLGHGVLELQAPSDAQYEVRIPAADADRVSRFELGERPERLVYTYPLERGGQDR